MKCLNCGKRIANDSVFCEFCGKKVPNEETIVDDSGKVEEKNPSQKPVENPKRKKKWPWLVGAGVAMIAVVLFLNIFNNYENYAQSFSEGLAYAEIKGKAGYIDKSGEMVITLPDHYNWGREFHDGLAAVRDEESSLWGYIDKVGRQVVVPQYQIADGFSEGFAHVVTTEWEHFFIDRMGQRVINLGEGVSVGGFHEGIARVDHCFIDSTGKSVLRPSVAVDYIWDFHESLAAVQINGKVGYIDKTGNLVIPPKYDNENYSIRDNWHNFSEGLAVVRINGKFGCIDKTGNLVIPPRYAWVQRFSDGLAAVEINGKVGYIDRTGNQIISPQYDWVGDGFSEGVAYVMKNGRAFFIDKNGNKVLTIR
jgi:hypothetical protein